MTIRHATLLAGLCLGVAYGQLRPTASPIPVTIDNIQPNQQIGVNDLIWISVTDLPELTHAFRVSPDGTLALPLLKRHIKAAGLLPLELESAVAKTLQEEEVLVTPVVSVAVMEYRSRPIKVAGAVKHPLTFQAIGDVTVLDAIGRAEGITADAGPEVLLSRMVTNQDGESVPQIQHIPMKALLAGADEMTNAKLVGGEEIRIPEAGRVYVAGNVKKPGSIPLHDAEDLTVLKALALSEGLTSYYESRAYIYRPDPTTGIKAELPIELAHIVERKSPDVSLQANDILYVPDNKARRLTLGTLEKIAGFGSATASGVLIYHK